MYYDAGQTYVASALLATVLLSTAIQMTIVTVIHRHRGFGPLALELIVARLDKAASGLGKVSSWHGYARHWPGRPWPIRYPPFAQALGCNYHLGHLTNRTPFAERSSESLGPFFC